MQQEKLANSKNFKNLCNLCLRYKVKKTAETAHGQTLQYLLLSSCLQYLIYNLSPHLLIILYPPCQTKNELRMMHVVKLAISQNFKNLSNLCLLYKVKKTTKTAHSQTLQYLLCSVHVTNIKSTTTFLNNLIST